VRTVLVLSFAALALAGCAEHEQTADGIKSDAAPFAGTDRQPPFMAAGWKPGERAGWEQHLKLRTLHQNEYVKIQ
jgi:hypothetical protein